MAVDWSDGPIGPGWLMMVAPDRTAPKDDLDTLAFFRRRDDEELAMLLPIMFEVIHAQDPS